MAAYIIVAIIIAYSGFIIYRKVKDLREGKSCCGGCSGCSSKERCNKSE
jgi:hypothetical protein